MLLILIVLGLCLGSFVNALVWRIHEQNKEKGKVKPDQKYLKSLSISKGHSICPSCKHRLNALDLIPVLSWVSLQGKCRYCKQQISVMYPLVEVLTAVLFVFSYEYWPLNLHGLNVAIIILWLLISVTLMALFVYDLKWYILPNKLIYPLGVLSVVFAVLELINSYDFGHSLLNLVLAVIVGGGIFYILFQVSSGKWIGGGDVKLGFVLGLVAGSAEKSLLFIFLASVIGSLISLPLLAIGKIKTNMKIPYGPLLIIGIVITYLFGSDIIAWYQKLFI
jgi:prepilin signal peptidase PulO-like enzyme (type II secretory pathway)